MKKILVLVLAMVMLLSACTPQKPAEEKKDDTNKDQTQQEQKQDDKMQDDKMQDGKMQDDKMKDDKMKDDKKDESKEGMKEPAKDAGTVVLYSSRHYDSDQALYDKFKQMTGITVEVKKADAKALLEEIEKAGEDSPADLFYTADAGKLAQAKEKGLFQPIGSTAVKENVPAIYRDTDDMWTALTMRARIIAYSLDRVKPEELSTYEDLTNAKWKGKIVTRPSSHVYNQSLVASLIEVNGEEKTKEWVKALVANFARDPKGNDRDQVKAVAAGEADLAIVNSYYIGRMMVSDKAEEKDAVAKVGVFFPNQSTTGTHVNVSGAGILKGAKNKENAVKLLEFLSSVEAQEQFSSANYEFPVNPNVAVENDLLKSWGEFKKQDISLSILGTNNKKAQEIMDEAGWK